MDKYHAQKEAGEPFYPYSLSKDAAAVLIVFVAIMALAWWFPAEVGQFPDPTDTNYNPRPEWYFLFLFQFLKYFPGSLEPVVAVVLPSLVFVGLLSFRSSIAACSGIRSTARWHPLWRLRCLAGNYLPDRRRRSLAASKSICSRACRGSGRGTRIQTTSL